MPAASAVILARSHGKVRGYEGVDRGLYLRVEIPRDSGGIVQTYIGNPARLGVADEWPGEGEFAERVRSYLDETAVRIRTKEY